MVARRPVHRIVRCRVPRPLSLSTAPRPMLSPLRSVALALIAALLLFAAPAAHAQTDPFEGTIELRLTTYPAGAPSGDALSAKEADLAALRSELTRARPADRSSIARDITLLEADIEDLRNEQAAHAGRAARPVAPPQTRTVRLSVRGDQLRYDGDTGSGTDSYTLIVPGERRVHLVNRRAKTVSTLTFDQMQGLLGRLRGELPGRQKDRPIRVERPGKTGRVLGYPTEQVTLSRGDGRSEVWVTSALGDVLGGLVGRYGPVAQAVPELGALGGVAGMPLQATTYVGSAVRSEWVVTKLGKTPPPAALFVLPADYSRQTGPGR